MESAKKALDSLRPRARTVNIAGVKPKDVRWLWPERNPIGKFTLLFGDPGLGKSFITLDMAARVSTGRAWPDGGACPEGSVLLIGAEDDVEDTVCPRLWMAGAEVSKIEHLDAVTEIDRKGNRVERSFTLDEVEALGRTLADMPDCKLIVIDPIGAF